MDYLKQALQHFPRLYLDFLKLKRRNHWSKTWVVDASTQVVIEGYPRSANSYFFSAFKLMQERELKIATHVHTSAQVIRACQLRLPTIVMLRHPLDAAMSFKALDCQCNPEKVHKYLKIPLSQYLKRYYRYYEHIYPYREQYIVALFEQVVQTISPTIQQLNKHFNTDFIARELTDLEQKKVFEEGGRHLSPNAKRELIKERIKSEVGASSSVIALQRAERIYYQLQSGSRSVE